MRLQSYLLNEGRTQSINEDEAVSILNSKCSKALKFYNKGNYICRDISTFRDPYGVIYPKPGQRVSRNTSNYYTLIINNHPAWKAYPKRDVICAFTKKEYEIYDYLVFPFDGAKIGVCPEGDMWVSFGNIYPEQLNGILDLILGNTPNDYNEMKKSLEEFTDLDHDDIKYSKTIQKIIGKKKFNNLWEVVLSVYGNPKKYGFQVVKIGDAIPSGKEIWTDSPCLFIYNRNIGDIIE